jgi:hypothetical protein
LDPSLGPVAVHHNFGSHRQCVSGKSEPEQRILASGMRERVREIARKRQRFGHLRITVLLRRRGLRVNHKAFIASAGRSGYWSHSDGGNAAAARRARQPGGHVAIEDFLSAWNENPRPFVWTATVDSILAKLPRCRQTFEQIQPGCTLPRTRKRKASGWDLQCVPDPAQQVHPRSPDGD